MPMTRRTESVTYRPAATLNKQKRPDHWFWTPHFVSCILCYFCRRAGKHLSDWICPQTHLGVQSP